MEKLIEYLKKFGVDEAILNHSAFPDLFSDVIYYFDNSDYNIYIEAKNDNIQLKAQGKTLLQIVKRMSEVWILNPTAGVSTIIESPKENGRITMRKESSGQYGKDIVKYQFLGNGLEQEREVWFHHVCCSPICVTRVTREPNGYIAHIVTRKVDSKTANIDPDSEFSGYMNLDMRYTTLVGPMGMNLSTPQTDILIKMNPPQYNSLEEIPHFSTEEAKEYLVRGMQDVSAEEQARWEKYRKGVCYTNRAEEKTM